MSKYQGLDSITNVCVLRDIQTSLEHPTQGQRKNFSSIKDMNPINVGVLDCFICSYVLWNKEKLSSYFLFICITGKGLRMLIVWVWSLLNSLIAAEKQKTKDHIQIVVAYTQLALIKIAARKIRNKAMSKVYIYIYMYM